MEKKTTHRIIGVLVVVALVVILMPLLFGGNHSEVTQTAEVKAPPFPDQDEATTPTRVGQQADNVANTNSAGPSAPVATSPENPPASVGQSLGALDPSQQTTEQDPLHPQTLAQDAGGTLNPVDLGPNPQATLNQPNDMAVNQSSGPPISNGPPMSAGQPISPGQPVSTGQPLSSGMPISSGQPMPSTQPLAGQAGQFNQPAAQTQQPTTTIQTNQFNQPNVSVQPSQAAQPAGQNMNGQPMQNPVPGGTTPATSSSQPAATTNQPMSNPGQPMGTPSLSSSDSSNTPGVSQTVSLNADGNIIAVEGEPVTSGTEKPVKKVAMNKAPKKHGSHVQASNNSESTQAALKQTAWVVQMGSFHNKENAQRLADNLRAKGFKAFTRQIKSSTRVYVGPEFKQASAESLIDKLQSAVNIQGIVLTYHPLEL